ncbi:hypothetical protein CRYUN_Cryun24cG0053300 [Craigia yunnanensis]
MFVVLFIVLFVREKLRIAVLVSKAAFQFISGEIFAANSKVKAAGFQLWADELGSIVEGHDVKKLKFHGEIDDEVYGINKFAEAEAKGFWVFVWEALPDMTLMIIGVCAFASLIVAISDYRQSLQFRDLDKEKKKITIQVTRNACRQKMSIYDLLPGDFVHLNIGDQVPTDGLFVSGFFVLIDESSLTEESEPVMVNAENPFMLSGTKLQDGSCKMMVTIVGKRTQWGKLMATLSVDETPLQVKLNGVATIIGKKMINDKALVRHLAACETMGSATSICSDKTGTLTTNHMTVVKSCICMGVKEVGNDNKASFCSEIPESAVKLLLQSIFTNTGGEIVINKDGKREILGTPTETALLEFGLCLGGDSQVERQASKLVKVEPFNSTKKRMGVVLQLPEGGLRAHTKGASEIVLAGCDKAINSNGEVVSLDEKSINHLNATINQFANEDPVRPGVKESVATCRSAGITVRMVTGDNINTAKAIARECGILTDDGIAIEGPYFREKSQDEMLTLIPKIQQLRTTFDEVVAVTGDGTNDAPALHKADIGLAMGISGTEEHGHEFLWDEGLEKRCFKYRREATIKGYLA